jgi:hypothetical protein
MDARLAAAPLVASRRLASPPRETLLVALRQIQSGTEPHCFRRLLEREQSAQAPQRKDNSACNHCHSARSPLQ